MRAPPSWSATDRCPGHSPATSWTARHTDGGDTSYANGRGVCARGNYVRELPGWQVTTINDGLYGRPHTTITTTPTGHRYSSSAP